jgi:hypothetical protein
VKKLDPPVSNYKTLTIPLEQEVVIPDVVVFGAITNPGGEVPFSVGDFVLNNETPSDCPDDWNIWQILALYKDCKGKRNVVLLQWFRPATSKRLRMCASTQNQKLGGGKFQAQAHRVTSFRIVSDKLVLLSFPHCPCAPSTGVCFLRYDINRSKRNFFGK